MTDKVRTQRLTACDISSCSDMLIKIKETADTLIDKVEGLTSQLQSGELDTKDGISFLIVKNELLGQYNLDVASLVSRKVMGKSIAESPTVRRLIEMRTYMEKTRPIEHKLKYQMEKLIKIAASGGLSSDDPLHLKPNPSNMVSKLEQSQSSEDEEDSGVEGEETKQKSGVYKPPMLSAAHYEEEMTKKEREEQMIAKAKKRALSTAMMRELRAEYSEAPEEVRDDMNMHRFKQSQDDKHRIAYEEDNFKRIMLTKDEKRQRHQMQTIGTLDKLTKFGDISALTGGFGDSGGKKRKMKSKSKGGHKKKKRIKM
ncbi:neuroguidin-like [Watersipora subatra]|uniref:neuroguidin-like n=1 Tax=Watersipora subatra TaxID=2589382 RepID=UPI00355C8051